MAYQVLQHFGMEKVRAVEVCDFHSVVEPKLAAKLRKEEHKITLNHFNYNGFKTV